MPRRRWCLVTVLGLCVLGVPAIFRADVTSVERDPDPPILVGEFVDYWVFADDSTGWFSMEWHCVGVDPGHGTWSSPPWYVDWDSFYVEYNRVGTLDLRFGAEEDLDPCDEDPPFWSYKTEQDTVLGPDTDEVASGLNVDSDEDIVEVRFDVLRGTTSMGGYIEAYAEEQLVLHDPWTNQSTAIDWSGQNENFYWDDSDAQIVDSKGHQTSSAGFQARNVNDAVLNIFQLNRLVIKNCAGEDEVFQLTTHLFQIVKTGANTWKMIELPIP